MEISSYKIWYNKPPTQLILELHYSWDCKNKFQNNEITHFAINLHWGEKLASIAIHLI